VISADGSPEVWLLIALCYLLAPGCGCQPPASGCCSLLAQTCFPSSLHSSLPSLPVFFVQSSVSYFGFQSSVSYSLCSTHRLPSTLCSLPLLYVLSSLVSPFPHPHPLSSPPPAPSVLCLIDYLHRDWGHEPCFNLQLRVSPTSIAYHVHARCQLGGCAHSRAGAVDLQSPRSPTV
jgi:hypothetical protein